MAIFYAMIPIAHIVIFSTVIYPSVMINYDQFSMTESNSNTENILSNTAPPTLTTEQQLIVTFYSSENISLKCNIDGRPRPNYQWYKSRNELTDGSSVQDQKFDPIPSANSDLLSIDGKSSTKVYSKYTYYCAAKNPLGILHTSKVVVEKMTRPLSIFTKHILHSVSKEQKLVVQCHLEPDLGPLYEFKCWEIQINTEVKGCFNQTVGRFSVISSTKFPQLHIRNVTNEDFNGIKVRCIYISTIKNHKETATSFFIPIEEFKYSYMPLRPNIICIGETVTATVGTNIELPWCTVPTTLNVTWFKIDNVDSKKKTEIGKRPNDSKFAMVSSRYGNLLIMNVTKDDAGLYLAENTQLRQSTTFTLHVYETPAIYLSPINIRRKISENAQFNCAASFTKSRFIWLHNGLEIVSGFDDGNIEISSTYNMSSLRVNSARLSVSGVYQCIASSLDEGKIFRDYRQISGTLLLSDVPPTLVLQSPRVEKDSSIAHIQMSLNKMVATIKCVFAANPRPNIDLYHNSKKVPITKVIDVAIQQDQNSIYNSIVTMTINLDKLESRDLMVEYAGEYQATARNSLGSAMCSTFILMDGDLQIKLPDQQTAIGANDYLLTCFFVAIDVPMFFWDRKVDKTDKWESLPVNHRTIFIEKGYRLHLKNVIKAEDAGIYRCTIKYHKETKSAETKLVVVYPPFIQTLPTKHDSSQGQTHICTIRSADKPWYTWWTFTKYNSTDTIIISPDTNNAFFNVYYNKISNYKPNKLDGVPEFVLNYPNVGVDLNVKARSNDKNLLGKFVCHAKNHFGSDTNTIEDNFLNLEFKIVPPSSSEVVVGDDLYLDCTAKESDLKPVVRWRLLKEDTKYVDINDLKNEHNGRIYQLNNGTLVMKRIKESDPSKLTCFIFPLDKSNNVQSKISYIEIRVPARIQKFEKEIFKEAGSSFNLSCPVYGHVPELIITWFNKMNDKVLWSKLHESCIYSTESQCLNPYQIDTGRFSPIIQIVNRTYRTVHLEFRNSTESISGQYKCEAKNKFNVQPDRTSTTLIIISKPSVVIIDSNQKETTSTTVEFDWKPPEHDGNRPILQYILNYYELSPMIIRNRTIRVNNTVHSIVIDQLRPNKKYAVEISAQNKVGISEPAIIHLMTQEAIPQRSVNDLKASSTKPDEILISWSDPDLEYQNGHIINFQMCYQIIPTTSESKVSLEMLKWPDGSMDLTQFPNVKCQETDKRTITVPYLPQFTDFAIRVIAFNSKGASPAAFTKVRTLEDLPQAPPSGVTCEGQHQAIGLTWNPPGRQTINGVLVGYAVYYYQPNKFRDESDMKSVIVQGRTHVVIDQLKPFTPYSIQVMASNRKGLGPASVSVICETKEAKPEAPESVKAVKINNTCVAVSWLHTKHPNGVIRQYCVVNLIDNVRSPICQPPDMTKRYNVAILCDMYGRFSTLQVFARNQYDGAVKEASKIDDINSIISIGEDLTVNEGSSVMLHCEILSDSYKSIYWKKDGREILNGEYPYLKILQNHSLEITSIGASINQYTRDAYQCSTEFDTIEYYLRLQENQERSPRTPVIDETMVTENSIFIRWKSRGTSDIAAPITGFVIKWTNFFTGESKTLNLDENLRSFYLNNVTCSSDFKIDISSQSGNGISKFSDSKQLRTLGSVPEIADTTVLLPRKNVEAHSATFNLLAFGPGNNCSATHFYIDISPTSNGGLDFTSSVFSKNISFYELENKCCYKVTGLKPMTQYQYRIMAYNPAGSTQSYSTIETPGINGGLPGLRQLGASTNIFANHSWLLMIILVIVIIFVLIIVIVGVLYILRSKEKKIQSNPTKALSRRLDFNPKRCEKIVKQEDAISTDSEPSPYAVYQPDTEQKIGQIWSQQVSQQSSTPQYNYTDHHYNQIRYDNHHDNYRRANSAECLSSLGNASVAGNADLESPGNIDPNMSQDYFRAPFTQCPDNDEVFQNIRYPDFSTVNRKRLRRESENLNRYNEEEKRLMKNSSNPGAMTRSRYYEPSGSQLHQQLMQHEQQQQQQQQRQLYQATAVPNHLNYRQQMSVPEPVSLYQQHYAYQSNRLRTTSGTSRNHPSSQNVITNNPGSSAQTSAYGSYYGSRPNNVQPYSTSSGVRRDNEPQNNQYSSYKPGSSNYNAVQRSTVVRPPMDRIESPDEGIYTDRVVVV